MSNIYDFPDLYDAVFRSPTEQIETEVNSIRRLLVEQDITKGSILELACGTCGHGILLAQGGFSVTGIDINPNMLEGAQHRMDTAGVKIKLIQGDIVDFDLGTMRFDCVIFMAETFPTITTYEDIKSHFRSVKRHLKPGGLYIIDMDAQTKIRTSSETGIWGKKTVRLDDGYVEVWHEDSPGDWVEGINRLVMHCRIYVNDTIYETTDDWSIRYYSPWMLSVLMQIRTCFKKQGMIPRCCGFVNPQRATSQGRGWVSQPIGLGNQAPTMDLTRFAEYGDNMPLNSGRPSGLRKKPSFEEKTRFHGK